MERWIAEGEEEEAGTGHGRDVLIWSGDADTPDSTRRGSLARRPVRPPTPLDASCRPSFMSVKPMAGFDMDNRDPNNINDHLQVREAATFVAGLSRYIYGTLWYHLKNLSWVA